MGSYSAYSGRLGNIIDDVFIAYNAESTFGKDNARLTTPLLVRLCNRASVDFANAGVWLKTTDINIVNGQASYNFLSLITDMAKVKKIYWTGYSTPMERLLSYDAYRALITGSSTSNSSNPCWFPLGNTILVWPTPTADIAAGMSVLHSYLPADLGGINYLTAGVAVNQTNKVDIPCINDFAVGDTITLYGTTNYNGAKTLITGTNPTTLRIAATYVAETFSITDYCIKTLNETPLIPEVHDAAYVYFCLMELASKDYMGTKYSDKLWAKFRNAYMTERGRLIHQAAKLPGQMGFPR
jgi:hypothetical protein